MAYGQKVRDLGALEVLKNPKCFRVNVQLFKVFIITLRSFDLLQKADVADWDGLVSVLGQSSLEAEYRRCGYQANCVFDELCLYELIDLAKLLLDLAVIIRFVENVERWVRVDLHQPAFPVFVNKNVKTQYLKAFSVFQVRRDKVTVGKLQVRF